MSLSRLALGAALLASSVQASIFIQAPKNYRSDDYAFEYRTVDNGNDSGWQDLGDLEGINFDGTHNQRTSYRIKGDDSSTALFQYKHRGSQWTTTDIVQGTEGVSVSTSYEVIVQYGSGPERKKREFFDETTPTEFLSFDRTVSLKRSGDCDYVDFKLKIVDEDGEEQFSIEEPLEEQWFGVGVWRFPAYGTFEFADGTIVDFTLSGLEGITYALADGELAPNVYGRLDYHVDYCPST